MNTTEQQLFAQVVVALQRIANSLEKIATQNEQQEVVDKTREKYEI